MIPKKIHYCWFGGNPLPELAQKCIESWKKFCPDYEIIEWNENNFDINYNAYVKEAFEEKKWAFITDVARLYALVNYGGIYMDTDVEVLKPLDGFLEESAFSGFESEERIPTGIMAAEVGQPLFQELLDDYKGAHFRREDGTLDYTTNVTRITNVCLKHGLVLNNTKQTVAGFTLYESEYFCPKDSETGKVRLTENTHAIHHFDGSWLTPEAKYILQKQIKYGKFMPKKLAARFAKFRGIAHCRGIKCAFGETFSWLKKKK